MIHSKRIRIVPAVAVGMIGYMAYFAAAVLAGPPAWHPVYPLPQGNLLHDVCSAGLSVFYAVGANGTIMRCSAGQWEIMDSGTCMDLNGVWAAAANDVFAVGAENTILHYDGVRWLPQFSGIQGWFWDVWGTGPQNVYAVGMDVRLQNSSGDGAVVIHYDGEHWTVQSRHGYGHLINICGTAEDDIYIAVNCSLRSSCYSVKHYDGAVWTTIAVLMEEAIRDMWVRGPDDMYILATALWHYIGGDIEELFPPINASGIWGTPEGKIILVGEGIAEGNGSIWTICPLENRWRFLWAIAGAEDGTAAAVGTLGIIASNPGTGWREDFPCNPIPYNVNDFWPVGPVEVYAITDAFPNDGRTIFLYDGAGWRAVGPEMTGDDLLSIRSCGSDALVAAGRHGAILTGRGEAWQQLPAPADITLDQVWASSPADIYAHEYDADYRNLNILWHYDGVSWSAQVFGDNLKDQILSLWGSGSADIYLSLWLSNYDENLLLHFNGLDWQIVDFGYPASPVSVAGSSSSDVYVQDIDNLIIHHYDGMQWTPFTVIPGIYGNASLVLDSCQVFWGGHDGVITFFDGAQWWLQEGLSSYTITGISGPDIANVFAVTTNGLYRYNEPVQQIVFHLHLNGQTDPWEIYPGDRFRLTADFFAPASANTRLWLALIVGDEVYYWPNWSTEPTSTSLNLPAGAGGTFSILDFTWPEAETVPGAEFFGLLADAETSEVLAWDHRVFNSVSP